jgi:dTDP-4-amino-4,6-dideoxygalactose transaminase
MKIPAAKIHFPEEEKRIILENIKEALDTGWLTKGKYNKIFEENFSKYVGTSHAVAVNGGTAALEIIFRSLGVQGKSVIVPATTFVATPGSLLHAGGKVVFADVDESLCMSLDNIKEKVTEETKGVVAVHLGGVVCPEIKKIRDFCRENGLFLVEDAAHAQGSSIDGQMAGSFGDAAAFSFFPTKVMTSAEGGLITTNSQSIVDKGLVLRDQGMSDADGGLHVELGYNWRLSELNAIVGISQLRCLESFLEGRRRAAALYDKLLANVIGLKPLAVPGNIKPSYYKYTVFLDPGIDRGKVKKEMRERFEVGLTSEVYDFPCHLQPVFKKMFGLGEGSFPVSEDLCRRQICLPINALMTEEEVTYVCDCLAKVVAEQKA